MDNCKVAWLEGMFVSPQHFQQQERYVLGQALMYLSSMQPGASGVAGLQLDHAFLKHGKLAIKQAHGIFPDGTPFSLTQTLVGDMPENFTQGVVYLALPLQISGAVEVANRHEEPRRYCMEQVELFDTVNIGNDPLETTVERLNLSLKMQGQDLSDYTVLPVASIRDVTPEGTVVLDESFIPSCLTVNTSDTLMGLLRELQGLVKQRAIVVLERVKLQSSYKSSHTLLMDFRWLQVLSHWQARLDDIVSLPMMHPRQLYSELCSMLGDLSALVLEPVPDNPGYRHARATQIFAVLFTRLRQFLGMVHHDVVIEIEWNDRLFQSRRLLFTQLPNKALYQSSRFVLAVKTTLPKSRTVVLFPQAAKLAPSQRINELVHNYLPGIDISYQPLPPVELKSESHTCYFEIDMASPLWKELVLNQDELALHLDEQIAEATIRLFAVR
ncbi:type VI secretion system baseplate subunit TssK [Spongorhabdus nitratireducens]